MSTKHRRLRAARTERDRDGAWARRVLQGERARGTLSPFREKMLRYLVGWGKRR